MIFRATPILLSLSALAFLSGCSSLLNTASNSEYSCPGMPNGVVCKTPAAVYKSTHLDPEVTDFDTPIGSPSTSKSSSSPVAQTASVAQAPLVAAVVATAGPRPVREPAKVVRIWIAPWVDKHDNLHLAQTLYAEIQPRTWTVGKPEIAANAGYVIPHRAFEGITPPTASPNERADARPSAGDLPAAATRASREASELVAPPN